MGRRKNSGEHGADSEYCGSSTFAPTLVIIVRHAALRCGIQCSAPIRFSGKISGFRVIARNDGRCGSPLLPFLLFPIRSPLSSFLLCTIRYSLCALLFSPLRSALSAIRSPLSSFLLRAIRYSLRPIRSTLASSSIDNAPAHLLMILYG